MDTGGRCPHRWQITAWKRIRGEYWDVVARCPSCRQTRREGMVGSSTVTKNLGWLPEGDYDPFGDLDEVHG